jgi:hypothetical protein
VDRFDGKRVQKTDKERFAVYRDKGVSWWVDSDLRGMTENSNLLHFMYRADY